MHCRRPLAFRAIAMAICLAMVTACGSSDDGALDVVLIGTPESVYTQDLRLSPGAQILRSATQGGLVALDAHGEVVPALAETWLPTEDGLSYIFRLRDIPWPDGSEMTAASARAALERAIGGLEGTALAQDLAPIEEVRAMAGRVIEIRLSAPEPDLLKLLAQPELALRHEGGFTGPMILTRETADEENAEEGDAAAGRFARLDFKPPLERGMPMADNWQDHVREVEITVAQAREAIAMFEAGDVELVLAGDLGGLPLVDTGPLSSGTLRVDATFGLFGLHVRRDGGLLGNNGVREALAMAIDREGLLATFNIGGLVPTTRPVSPGLPGDPGFIAERWRDMVLAERRQEAAVRIDAWRRQFDDGDLSQPARLTITMGEGPGWDRLLQELDAQMAQIGITIERSETARTADLALMDKIARYPAPRWFLNQFHCGLELGLCSEAADELVAQAMQQMDLSARASLMAQAEAELMAENVYIPIGAPLRWSLVRGGVEGFEANIYGFHPLPPMAQRPR